MKQLGEPFECNLTRHLQRKRGAEYVRDKHVDRRDGYLLSFSKNRGIIKTCLMVIVDVVCVTQF